VQELGEFEPVLLTEINVDQRHVRPQLLDTPERLSAGRGHAGDRDPLTLEQIARSVAKGGAVINDEAAQQLELRHHDLSFSECTACAHSR
jgi:hypothetical protein